MKTRIGLVLTAAALSFPAVARAQPAPGAEAAAQPDPAAEARRQYNLGKAAYEAGRYAEAALAWEAAVAIKPHAATLYSAALAWERSNHPERAADDFGRSIDVPGLNPPELAKAKERLATLERALGTVLVTGPEGWQVQIDSLTEVGIPARLHAMPGAHTLIVRAPGQPLARRDVMVDVGKMSEIDLSPGPAESTPVIPAPVPKSEAGTAPVVPSSVGASEVPARPTPARKSLDIRRAVGFGLAGMGLATVGAGIVLGIEALDARDAYNAVPTRGGYNHATSLQTWTNVAFVAGGVLAAGGVVLIVLPSHAAEAARFAPQGVRIVATPGGVSLGGRF